MDPVIAATLIGVMVSALLGVFAGAFHLLRSDLRDLRAENRDLRVENREDHRETNRRIDRLEGRIDRLEGKLDGLILGLGRSGFLVDPHAPQPPSPPGSGEAQG